MTSRSRHPHKEIEAAVQYAEGLGWRVILTKGHGWARLLCPKQDRTGCQISVWSTPKNPEGHARKIIRLIDSCSHQEPDDENA
jgi:hypothetical protein